jgi:N,N-dimethylformamidase
MTPTVMGYVDALTARPGETVSVRVSVLDPARRYRAELVRLLCGDTGPKGPGLKEEVIPSGISGEHIGGEQPTFAGSYAAVESLPTLGAVELEILAWPTLPGRRRQTLMAIGPVRLALDETGAAALFVGDDDVVSTGVPLRSRQWFRLRASFDPATGDASIANEPLPLPGGGFHAERPACAERRCATGLRPSGPLVFAAELTAEGRPAACFNGKLEAPRLTSPGFVAAIWDFADGIGTTKILDRSPHGLHGRTVNAPKRAVTGAAWDGSVHDWRRDPSHYGAIHFHEDDLYDAGWAPSLALRLPDDLRSGFYAVRLQASGPPFYVGFIVSPRAGAVTAPVAVLASTVTYLAYANYRRRMSPGPFELTMGALPTIDATDILLAEHPELGASTYDLHPDGSGVCHASARRPLFNMRPTGRFWNFSMDLCLIDWLEAQGIAYDVVSDHDLHARGRDLLRPYRVVMTGSHPEYHSLEMLKALEAHVGEGGRLMYMGGNGFYWRVTFSPAHLDMIELRRAEDGTRAWAEAPGEYYHSTGEYGGLWRRLGRPPNALVGVGFIAQGFDASSYYRRTEASRDPRAAFLFDGIDEDIIGDFGAWGDGAAGLELDAHDIALGTPAHALVVASSENHSNAFLLVNEEMLSNAHGTDGTLNPRVRADIVFFEAPNGGAVFSTGSIAFVASLAHDGYRNPVSRLVRNALDRFLDPAPFELPPPPPQPPR